MARAMARARDTARAPKCLWICSAGTITRKKRIRGFVPSPRICFDRKARARARARTRARTLGIRLDLRNLC